MIVIVFDVVCINLISTIILFLLQKFQKQHGKFASFFVGCLFIFSFILLVSFIILFGFWYAGSFDVPTVPVSQTAESSPDDQKLKNE